MIREGKIIRSMYELSILKFPPPFWQSKNDSKFWKCIMSSQTPPPLPPLTFIWQISSIMCLFRTLAQIIKRALENEQEKYQSEWSCVRSVGSRFNPLCWPDQRVASGNTNTLLSPPTNPGPHSSKNQNTNTNTNTLRGPSNNSWSTLFKDQNTNHKYEYKWKHKYINALLSPLINQIQFDSQSYKNLKTEPMGIILLYCICICIWWN